MTQSVSVPEKTLEHWSSLYLTYRYRSQVSLWWPTRGEDIDLQMLPTTPGKALQLELKTTAPAGTGLHDLNVDLGQLWEYSHKPLGRQPFYAFPRPDWDGNLVVVAKAKHPRKEVTELAFRRSGPQWWFAEWMVVLTTRQVADVLRRELKRTWLTNARQREAASPVRREQSREHRMGRSGFARGFSGGDQLARLLVRA